MTPPGVTTKVSLAPFTSWQIGGEAEFFSRPVNTDELVSFVSWAKVQSLPIHILGGGSNVLISDGGLKGLTIVLDRMRDLKVEAVSTQELVTHMKGHSFGSDRFHPSPGFEDCPNRLSLVADAGVGKNELLKNFLKHRLAPALFLAGIPGTVGGGVVMNAGVAEGFVPREFCGITDWIEVLRPSGEIEKVFADQLTWSYRHCDRWQPGVLLKVGMSWPLLQDDEVLEKVKQANKLRLSKQPLELPSCGSVFVNPPGHKAAQLTDSCGLKGYRVGGAQVSPKHANFIVNTGGATAEDVRMVIEYVKSTVLKQKQVQLKTEVVFMGFE